MSDNAVHLADPASVERPCQALSLEGLIERIAEAGNAEAGNAEALRELNDHRPLFRLRGQSEPMLLADFLRCLQETLWARMLAAGDSVVADMAYDLSIDKWSNLHNAKARDVKSSGPDCRLYYKSVLRQVRNAKPIGDSENALEEERRVARILQQAVVRHYKLACLEARRSRSRAMRRYGWDVGGGRRIYLQMPAWMTGRQRRLWLEEHVSDVDPNRPGERSRMQAIVDRELGSAYVLPLADTSDCIPSGRTCDSPVRNAIVREMRELGLPRAIANEKADSLDEQRPTIRALGKANLRKLVLRVFDDICAGCYEEKRLAVEFGLSQPTFTRFAGGEWEPGDEPLPDLWKNVSMSLGMDAAMMEVAEGAGFADR